MDECKRPPVIVIVQTWHGARAQHYAVSQHHAPRLLHCRTRQLSEHEVCISLCIYSAITSHAVIFSLAHDMSMLEGGDCTCMQALPQAFVFGHHLLEGHAAC